MTEQLFQIGIKAIIRNDENQILLLKNKDYWDIPGGRIDQGEDIETTLLRELNEEIGVNHIAQKQLWDVVKSVKQLPYGNYDDEPHVDRLLCAAASRPNPSFMRAGYYTSLGAP